VASKPLVNRAKLNTDAPELVRFTLSQRSWTFVELDMGADVIYLEKDRGQLVVSEKKHDGERVDMSQITQICVRLVYCMAAFDDDGMSRRRRYRLLDIC
jgi:hypothetical protein